MGIEENIRHDTFPKQGSLLNEHVNVCFAYDTKHCIHGKVVRHDAEQPFKTIIKLNDGRYVLATECQYQLCKLDVIHAGFYNTTNE